MARKSRFAIAEKSILAFFEKSTEKVFTKKQLYSIYEDNWVKWNLSPSSSANKFILQLQKKEIISELDIAFEGSYEKKGLFGLADASVYHIANAIHPKAYLSHYSAMLLQNLTVQIPKTVYITFERSKPLFKKIKPQLHQADIDTAFSKPQRTTASFAQHKNNTIYIVNGSYTNQLGVYLDQGFRLTNLERTLIDITVRPTYAGGVAEVLMAYESAKERLSINKLLATVKRLDFIYPYHQAIGFYLEKVGYTKSQLEPFKKLGIDMDFYLAHDMKSRDFATEWRVYHPVGM